MAKKKTAQHLRERLHTHKPRYGVRARAPECPHCAGEPEPGWIETPNNGPIVPCPVCNSEDRP